MCNSHRRRLVRATVLGVCGALAASAAQAGTVETRTAFGRIEMVEEVRTLDPGEMPFMHMANEWTKLHLRWRSADGVVRIDVIDGGWTIEARVSAEAGQDLCIASADHLQYGGVAGEDEIKDQVREVIASLANGCPVVSPAAAVAHARTLADGATDFVAAEDGMRARALQLFKRPLTRCLAPPPPPRRSKADGPPVVPMFYGPPAPKCR
jgi:hypothetical protein